MMTKDTTTIIKKKDDEKLINSVTYHHNKKNDNNVVVKLLSKSSQRIRQQQQQCRRTWRENLIRMNEERGREGFCFWWWWWRRGGKNKCNDKYDDDEKSRYNNNSSTISMKRLLFVMVALAASALVVAVLERVIVSSSSLGGTNSLVDDLVNVGGVNDVGVMNVHMKEEEEEVECQYRRRLANDHHRDDENDNDGKDDDDKNVSVKDRMISWYREGERMKQKEKVDEVTRSRAEERFHRTRPPSSSLSALRSTGRDDDELLLLSDDIIISPPLSFHLGGGKYNGEQQRGDVTVDDDDENKKDAKVNLCGKHAQRAFKNYPRYYPPEHALGPTSRVVIVGIVSNPIGVQLALELYRQCNVSNIIGVDTMLPNTSIYRGHLINDYIALLQRHIPNFKLAPLSFVGVFPRISLDDMLYDDDDEEEEETLRDRRKKSLVVNLTKDEMKFDRERFDFMNEYGYPTHVVHLASYHDDVISKDGIRDYGNVNGLSPYGDKTPFMQIRQGMIIMDQIFGSLVRYQKKKKREKKNQKKDGEGAGNGDGGGTVQFTYASSDRVYSGSKTDNRNDDGVNNAKLLMDENKTVKMGGSYMKLYGALRIVDEVLANTYRSLYDIHSIGLRLSSVYGPYGIPGGDVYDIAERIVRGNNNSGGGGECSSSSNSGHAFLSKSQDGTREIDLLYAEDAVNAILAAMQFRSSPSSSSPGPTAAGEDDEVDKEEEEEEEIPTVFNIGAGTNGRSTLNNVVHYIMEQTCRGSPAAAAATTSTDGGEVQKMAEGGNMNMNMNMMSSKRSEDMLGWETSTSIKDGLANVVEWQRQKWFPYSIHKDHQREQVKRDKKEQQDTADIEGSESLVQPKSEWIPSLLFHPRHVDPRTFPCVSGCTPKKSPFSSFATASGVKKQKQEEEEEYSCTSSVFDNVIPIVNNITEEAQCEYVMYTANFDPKLTKLQGSTKSTDQDRENSLCKLAFVSSVSPLVTKLIKGKKKAKASTEENEAAVLLGLFNGKLEHSAWKIIWLTNNPHPISDLMLIKISPSNAFGFSTRIKKAMYFSSMKSSKHKLPPTRDVLKVMESTDFHGKGPGKRWVGVQPYRKKIVSPAMPPRKSILFVPQPIIQEEEDEDEDFVVVDFDFLQQINKNLNYLLAGIHFDDDDTTVTAAGDNDNGLDYNLKSKKEPSRLRAQRKFYDYARTILQAKEFRSPHHHHHHNADDDPYITRNDDFPWIYSQWIVHDLSASTSDQSQQLRCDWYGEYLFWHGDNNNDADNNYDDVVVRADDEGEHDDAQQQQQQGRRRRSLHDYPPEFTGEDMSLGYILAIRGAFDIHSKECHEWITVLNPNDHDKKITKSTLKTKDEDKYWYLNHRRNIKCLKYKNQVKNVKDYGLFVRLNNKDVTQIIQYKISELKKELLLLFDDEKDESDK